MSLLKDLIGSKLYEQQKKMFKKIVDGGKKEIVKAADKIYVVQKEVIKDVQDAIFKKAADEATKLYNENFDKVVEVIKDKVPFIGGILAAILRKYKQDILEALK